MDRRCVAREIGEDGVIWSCLNVSGLWVELIWLLAIMEVSAHAILLADKPLWGCMGHQFSRAPGRPLLHFFLSLSQTSVGRIFVLSRKLSPKALLHVGFDLAVNHSLKGAFEKGEKSSPRMMVSAYSTGLRLTLATVVAKDRNEVDAALEVIGLIDLKVKIVTGDALHCNGRMVETIIEKGADYCIALKGNQDSLLSDARACLAEADKLAGKKKLPVAKTEDSGHGRIETRTAIVVAAKGLAEHHEFLGLTAFGRIEATRVIDGKIETDVRIFVLSRKLSPKALLATARDQWHIENRLHWHLDVFFNEDAARNRKDNGPANIAVIRRRTLDVARLDKSKGSLTEKLKRAGWNDDFMLQLLNQMR